MTEYQDEETLQRLYWNDGLSHQAIADKFGVAKGTIQYWFRKHNISSRPPTDERPPNFAVNGDGYEYWKTKIDGEQHVVYVHRLLAVAEFGFDAVKDNIVHHRSEVPWDNRPGNIGLMTQSDHVRLHKPREGTGEA